MHNATLRVTVQSACEIPSNNAVDKLGKKELSRRDPHALFNCRVKGHGACVKLMKIIQAKTRQSKAYKHAQRDKFCQASGSRVPSCLQSGGREKSQNKEQLNDSSASRHKPQNPTHDDDSSENCVKHHRFADRRC